MKVCWVLMRGMKQPVELGHGDPVETSNELILYDADKNVIGRFALTDLRGWWATDVGGTD